MQLNTRSVRWKKSRRTDILVPVVLRNKIEAVIYNAVDDQVHDDLQAIK